MQYSPQELKEKLLRALDEDNNVVDMRAVLDVISILESYPVTLEALEETRIGKYVNEMRRKTSDQQLAKRAKNLVRKWKLLMEKRPSGEVVNGEGLTGGVSGLSHLPHGGTGSGSKPSSPVSQPGTPSSIKSANLSPSLTIHSRPTTPTGMGVPHRPNTAAGFTPIYMHQSRLSPGVGKPGLVGGKLSPALITSKQVYSPGGVASPGLPARAVNHKGSGAQTKVCNHQGLQSSPGLAGATSSPGLPSCRASSPSLPTRVVSSPALPSRQDKPATPVTSQTLSKGNVANRKRRRGSPDQLDVHEVKKAYISNEILHNDTNGTKEKGASCTLNGLLPGSHNGSMQDKVTTSSSCDNLPGTMVGQTLGSTKATPNRTAGQGASSTLLKTPETRGSLRRSATVPLKVEEKSREKMTPAKTPKVKTTAQLIEEMRSTQDLRVAACSRTIDKINRNEIKKEIDPSELPVVPPEAKPRPRRKPGTIPTLPTSAANLSRTKTEMVEKFLQTSIAPTSSELDLVNERYEAPSRIESPAIGAYAVLEEQACSPITPANNSNESTNFDVESISPHPPVRFFTGDDSEDECELGPNLENPPAPVDPWALLPPLDLDGINWEEDDYPAPIHRPVSQDDIVRLHTEQWPGVTGQYDYHNEWHTWTQTYSMPSYAGDLLHILPYVNIDD